MKRYILAVMFLASFIAAEDIGLKFRLEPYDNISPKENISFFVPFAKGVLTGNEDILLAFPGLKIFPQKKIICSWDDKSVRVLELSLAGLEGRTTLEGVIYWGNLEKQKKEAEEKEKKAAGPDLTKKIPEWQKEKLKSTLGKIDAFAKPADYKLKVFAVFEPKWYCNSRVWGDLYPSADNFRWAPYERRFEISFRNNTGRSKKSGKTELSTYDTAHALFQMFLRSGDKEYLFAGHKEAKRYIEEEIFKEGQFVGQHASAKGLPIPARGLTLLYIEGLVDDYMLTGDTASLGWAKLMAEQLLKNMKESDLKLNEGNPGWPALELLALYNVTGDERYINKAKKIIEGVLSWQDASGGWKHVYEDKEECPHGHKGGSASMTAILSEGLIRYHILTGDKKVEKALLKATDWMLAEMYMPTQKTFRYTQCPQSTAPGTYGINPLYIEMLGYATYISKDEKYRTAAVEIMDDTLDRMDYATTLEEFSACYRSSGRGLYWLYKDSLKSIKMKLLKIKADLTKEIKK